MRSIAPNHAPRNAPLVYATADATAVLTLDAGRRWRRMDPDGARRLVSERCAVEAGAIRSATVDTSDHKVCACWTDATPPA